MDKLADESHSVSGDVDVDISYIAGSLKKQTLYIFIHMVVS